jgi:predicted  nucleic acid-binding Zn-ribbon protein
LKAVDEQHRVDTKALDEKVRSLETEAKRFRVDRDEVAKGITEDTLALYERVAKFRGSGVAEVKDEMCQACHVKLRPLLYMDLKKNEAIVQCNACSRILFYEPPVPVVAHHP